MTPRKKTASVLSDADEAELKKLSRKERANAVSGKPDQSDIDNLNRLFYEYERANPGRFKRMRNDYELQKALEKKVINPDFKPAMWMPKDLQEVVEHYWPTLWTNKEHLEWFIRHYPGFKA